MFKRVAYLIILIFLSMLLVESVRNNIALNITSPILHNIGIKNNNANVIILSGNLKRYARDFSGAKLEYTYVIKHEDLAKQKNALELAYLNLGHTFYKKGDYSNAAKAYYLTLRKNPSNKQALLPFVRINMAYGKTEQIVPIVEKYVSQNHQEPKGYTELCAVYNRIKEYNLARVNCQYAIQYAKHYARARYDYSVALDNLGFDKEAEKELKLAKKLQPGIKSREELEKIMISVAKNGKSN